LGAAPTAPPSLDGDKMFHLLDRFDDDFLAQIADVIVGESGQGEPKETTFSPGEAPSFAASYDQPVAPQLLPPKAARQGGVDQLVGSSTTELESGEDISGQGLNTTEALDAPASLPVLATPLFTMKAVAPVSRFLSPKNHLLDHMYACPEPANFDEPIIYDNNLDKYEIQLTNDLSLTTPTDIFQDDESSDLSIPERLHPTRDITSRKRKSSVTSASSTSAKIEIDSAYGSPSATSPPASPVANTSPLRDSFTQVKNITHSRHSKANQLQLPNTADVTINFDVQDESDSSLSRDGISRLDLDLLDSLLTKDILNDMGQVILNEDLMTTMTTNDDIGSDSSSGCIELFGSEDGKDDFFAGLFGGVDGASEDEDLVKDFDTTDWESTFNELFLQL